MNALNRAVCALAFAAGMPTLIGCTHTQRRDAGSLGAVIAAAAQPVENLCVEAPEICAGLCARCPDVAACIKADGRCAAADYYFVDRGDGGMNPFTPGCHMTYDDVVCTVNPTFLSADWCNGNILHEWWLPVCHPGVDDVVKFDCADICRRMGRSGGSCKTVANACPGNHASAHCVCEDLTAM